MASSITQTFGKVLNTIGTVADAATKTVDNVAAGLDMLDMFVMTAKQKQEARTAADMHTFYDDLQNEVALENALKAEQLEIALNNNAQLKKHFTNQHEKLNSVINKVRTKYNPE
ncbi:hypothetical protein Ab1vBOLIVR2_gp17 [Agrobacterium phage OLIVR2]|uniref:Uncharacterized protein n=1 Tax=Agrobacterium phage OLIVR1 TaxID=2723769 RepID=A0A858MR00_9CAUD|nr:hypothetical protein [Xanthomonas campestris]YP_010107051.1 hypothetical protein KNU98_gp092 [Agrobacterium phage OLIVR1]QIW87320.1 hypothetical protein Ab1vBOLIVR2_gp17 [Agrobacterium phage OLIVR2]QIW87427.1 hypothetical protein Ab1vBOLIVR3_gp17 [Agrobacterium phage OLIVR3]MCF8861615.1 hypothetical protein [Xanthomonas campestris pv. campestris]QIW87212.1 hypothetical protein Ab1vBOLIVR1_gp17 [Agrobacterium phage OLIVR1]